MISTLHSLTGTFVLPRVSQGEQSVVPPPVPHGSSVSLDSRPHEHSGEERDLYSEGFGGLPFGGFPLGEYRLLLTLDRVPLLSFLSFLL